MPEQIEEVLSNKLLTLILGLFIPMLIALMAWNLNTTVKITTQTSKLAAQVESLVVGDFVARVASLEAITKRNTNDIADLYRQVK